MSEQKVGYGRFDAYAVSDKNPLRPGGSAEFVAVTRGELDALRAELIAERTRRLKAEEVVDKVIFVSDKGYGGTRAIDRAREYRTQYPRVEEDK